MRRPVASGPGGGTSPATAHLLHHPESGGAIRVDPKGGIREEIGFFQVGTMKLLGALYLPLQDARAGLVICSPIGEEFMRNYRREVLLARALAAAGFAVYRFHYRGSGSSDGDTADLTVHTMLEDTLTATTLLQRQARVGRLGFLGTRLGAFPAAAVARRFPGAPLVLWEPALNGRRYMDEVFRARLVQALRKEDGAEPGQDVEPDEPADDLSELRQQGFVDVLGYPISVGLYESAVGRRLAEDLGAGARPVLLTQIGARQRFRHEYARLADAWRHEGWNVETLTFVYPGEAWWFVAPDDTIQPGARMRAQKALIEATGDWLGRILSVEEAP